MAEKKTKPAEDMPEIEATRPDPEEMIDYQLPMVYTDRERDLVVGVNGELIRIKRGVPVRIKRKFVEVIEASERQKRSAYDAMKRAEDAGRQAVAKM